METATIEGKAAPPRPTLLCGDLIGCHKTFSRLKHHISALEDSNLSWPDLVPMARSLRESLLSLGKNKTPFAQEVYECAADVCIQASDYPEALKCFQQLLSLYQQLDIDENDNGIANNINTDNNNASSPSSSLASNRWSEVAAAYVAYFKCVPGPDALDTAATLRRFPRHILASQHMKLALAAIDCLHTGNYVGFFTILDKETTPPLLKGVLQSKSKSMQEHAVVVMCSVYRVLPTVVAMKWLGMVEYSSLLQVIKMLADKGHAGAVCALECVQMSNNEQQVEKLVFK